MMDPLRAGAWLFTVPKNPKTIMEAEAETFRKCCRLRLGLAFNELPGTCLLLQSPQGHRSVQPLASHLWACAEFKFLLTDRHDRCHPGGPEGAGQLGGFACG